MFTNTFNKSLDDKENESSKEECTCGNDCPCNGAQ